MLIRKPLTPKSRNVVTIKTTGNNTPKTLHELLPWTPEWALPFLKPSRFKAAYGGRSSGKSFFFADLILARMILDPTLQCLVIRKTRKSITLSNKLVLEGQIRRHGWGQYFQVQSNAIKRIGGPGFITYVGLQEHNADGVRSFANFKVILVEEATEINQRSLDILLPTIREEGNEKWFLWNPDQPDDPVDKMFRVDPPRNSIIVRTSYKDNPFLAQDAIDEAEDMAIKNPEAYAHIYGGEYNNKSDTIVFRDKWVIDTIDDLSQWDGPYFGADFGFVADPTVALKLWKAGRRIYIEKESYKYRVSIDNIATAWMQDIPGIERYLIRADSSEQDTIDYLRRHGLSRIIPVTKRPGSVKAGVRWLQGHEFIIHPDCTHTQSEFKRYRLKTNAAGDPLDDFVDADNHAIDSARYAFEPLISSGLNYDTNMATYRR